MKYQIIIGITLVMLATSGIASADVFTFDDTSGGTYATGQITFDENGIVNGACIAGVTNGEMDVQQQTSQDGGNVLIQQSGDIQGDAGFAGTLADDGNGNQGGNFASFSGGSMYIGQATVAGDTTYEFRGFGDDLNTPSDGQVSAVYPSDITLGGVATGQVVDIEGISGTATTAARSGNGGYAQSSATFAEGGMYVMQGSAAGAASLPLPYAYGACPTSGEIQVPAPIIDDLSLGGVISGQMVDMGGASGSASTFVTNGRGASGQTSASFVSGGDAIGGMSTIQVAGAVDASLGLALSTETLSTLTGSPLTESEVLELSAGGIFAGQSGGMGGASGYASTSVTNVNGHSAGSAVSFTDTSHMGSMDFDQLSAGITEVSLGGLSDSHLSGVITYQDAYSHDFSDIAASSYARTPGNSLAQVNTIAQHSYLRGTELSTSGTEFETAQFAGGITSGNLDIALAGQDVDLDSVSSGSAGGFSSDSQGNTASVIVSVDSGDLRVGSGYIIPSGILAGAGDLGGVSGALAAYTSVTANGASGDLRSDSSNSIGQNAYVHSEFSGTGSLSSSSFGGALSGQSSGTYVIGAMGQSLASSGSTYLLETGTTGATPQSTTTTGTHTAYSLSWPGGYIGDPPISVIT